MSANEENYYAEDYWLEFLEGELEPSFAQDMAMLLNNSPCDRQTLEELAKTRDLIQASDDVALPEDGRYYDLLHSKIMRAVHATSEPLTGAAAEEEAKQNWAVMIDTIVKRREATDQR